jgi:hypothetical protein
MRDASYNADGQYHDDRSMINYTLPYPQRAAGDNFGGCKAVR